MAWLHEFNFALAFVEQRGAGADAGGARFLSRTEMAPLTRSCCFPRHHKAAGAREYCSWYVGLVSGEGTDMDGGTTLVARSSAGAGQ